MTLLLIWLVIAALGLLMMIGYLCMDILSAVDKIEEKSFVLVEKMDKVYRMLRAYQDDLK